MANPEHLRKLKEGVEAWNLWRRADFYRAQPDLSRADLTWADLHGAILSEANFSGANLTGADLSEAHLGVADLSRTNFSGANLRGANLTGANLRGASLSKAQFANSLLSSTVLGNVDLSSAQGLDVVQHRGPSTIGIDTVFLSGGKIPESFLRGAGVPEPFITNMKALVGAMKPFEFYSCFISYSSKDHDFAERLYADLQSKGVRCWFAPEDMKIGDKIRPCIDEAIRVNEKRRRTDRRRGDTAIGDVSDSVRADIGAGALRRPGAGIRGSLSVQRRCAACAGQQPGAVDVQPGWGARHADALHRSASVTTAASPPRCIGQPVRKRGLRRKPPGRRSPLLAILMLSVIGTSLW